MQWYRSNPLLVTTVMCKQSFKWKCVLANGVFYLHKIGIIHRDIKPSNVMVGENLQEEGQVKLIDLGLGTYCTGQFLKEEYVGTEGFVIRITHYCNAEQCTIHYNMVSIIHTVHKVHTQTV